MLPDRVSNPAPLTYESGALPIALRSPADHVLYLIQDSQKYLKGFRVIEKFTKGHLVGWLFFWFNGPLRQYFSLYCAVSQREGARGDKR